MISKNTDNEYDSLDKRVEDILINRESFLRKMFSFAAPSSFEMFQVHGSEDKFYVSDRWNKEHIIYTRNGKILDKIIKNIKTF